MPGDRNPQSAAEEFAPPPQGENVLDASMMAELIVTKKEVSRQLQKSTRTSRVRPKSPGVGGQRLPLAGRHGAEHAALWFLGLGGALDGGGTASDRARVEGKIGTYTAAWTQVIQGHLKIGGTGSASGGVTLVSIWLAWHPCMVRRRARDAGIKTKIGNHTFRATGITTYLKNGGKLEIAQQIAAHESSRTTGLYDRRDDDVSLDEVERIGIG